MDVDGGRVKPLDVNGEFSLSNFRKSVWNLPTAKLEEKKTHGYLAMEGITKRLFSFRDVFWLTLAL